MSLANAVQTAVQASATKFVVTLNGAAHGASRMPIPRSWYSTRRQRRVIVRSRPRRERAEWARALRQLRFGVRV